MSQQQADPAYIKKVLDYLFEPGEVEELRILKTRYRTVSGYFDKKMDVLASTAAEWSGQAPGVYVTLNPCDPKLLARADNHVQRYAEHTTADKEILRRRWFPIDVDPNRPAGISSTDAEHNQAIDTAKEIVKFLIELGIPRDSIIFADSGNGGHVLVRIDLPNDDESRDLLQRCIEAIAIGFGTKDMIIDPGVFNAARIWKLYGTMACKGDNVPDRPHRMSKIIFGEGSEICPAEPLRELSKLAPEKVKPNFNGTGSFDVETWIVQHGIEIKNQHPWNGGTMYVLDHCYFDDSHENNGAAWIARHSTGAVSAGCHHARCAGKGWHDLREIVEPGWRSKRSDNFQPRQQTDDTESREEKTKPSPWAKAKDAPTFLSEPDTEIKGVAKDLIVPGTISILAAPRGIGKTLVAHAAAVAMAKGGEFRGEHIDPLRVLLVDRDNPSRIVKQRLRDWGALDAANLKVLTRENAPDLKDKAAWESFPIKDYDVVVIDSLGSFTEGITEKEGKETTLVLATILDLIMKGPAVLLLANCTKDALSIRGRGEWQDRVDIQYEVRDATEFTPSGKKDWWLELPEAGESAWAERAARRKSRIDYRLAFIPSKFRLGAQPAPFCLEVRLPKDETWTLEDVTKDLIEAGENTIKEAAAKKEEREKAAVNALAEVVKERHQEGNPILKDQAVTYLNKEMEIAQKRSRELIAAYKGELWEVRPIGGKGGGSGLFPLQQDMSTTKMDDGEDPPPERTCDGGISVGHAQSGQREWTICKPAPRADLPTPPFSSSVGAISREQGLNGSQETSFSNSKSVDGGGFNWQTGEQEEERYIGEERAEIEDDDGFEDVPK
jgi:AAA domain